MQVAGWAEPGKAPPVSARLLLKGRTAMLTPGAPGLNLARSLRDPDRRAALAALAEAAMAGADPGLGLVLRTAAGDADGRRDRARRSPRCAPSGRRSSAAGRPARLLRPAPGAAAEALRDWRLPGDGLREAPTALADAGDLGGGRGARADPLVPLGEGSMAIEPTRALVAVDVNTGGDLSPAAALKVNLAAAAELPRQLRLRGLGGQVTIDFAPLARAERPRVERALAAALRRRRHRDHRRRLDAARPPRAAAQARPPPARAGRSRRRALREPRCGAHRRTSSARGQADVAQQPVVERRSCATERRSASARPAPIDSRRSRLRERGAAAVER